MVGTSNPLVRLAGHRYGREDMLGLYTGNYPPPDNINDVDGILVKHPMIPVSLDDTYDEDQVSTLESQVTHIF